MRCKLANRNITLWHYDLVLLKSLLYSLTSYCSSSPYPRAYVRNKSDSLTPSNTDPGRRNQISSPGKRLLPKIRLTSPHHSSRPAQTSSASPPGPQTHTHSTYSLSKLLLITGPYIHSRVLNLFHRPTHFLRCRIINSAGRPRNEQ